VGRSSGLGGAENLSPTGIQSPDRPARSEYWLYLLRCCRGPHFEKGQERDLEHGDIQTASKIFYELFRSHGEVCV